MTVKHLYPAVEPSLNLDFANSKRLDSRITFTRGSTGTYTDESGVIQTAAANEARFDHDSDGNSLGLLIEESRTNRRKYSNDFSSNVYVATGVTVAPNHSLSPDGSITATLVSDTATTSAHLLEGFSKTNSRFTTVTGENITCSVFVKPVQGTQYIRLMNRQVPNAFVRGWVKFDVVNKTVSSSESLYGVIPYKDGWYRIWFSFTAPGNETVSQRISFAGGTSYLGGNDSFLVFGVCVENGSFPTSYIPTSGSTVTRSADVASITGTNFSSWYNQSEGTLFAQWVSPDTKQFSSPAIIKESTAKNGPRIYNYAYTGNKIYALVKTTAENAILLTSAYSPSSPLKTIIGYSASEVASTFNGNSTQTASVTTPIPTMTRLDIGDVYATNDRYSNHHISRIIYYPTRLPDATLQALTL
jgi:hypothetical protein